MGKIGSTILTFLFSIPITAVGFMAIFGVPPIAALNASPKNDDVVIRDPYDQDPWGNSFHNQQQQIPNSSQDAPPYDGIQNRPHQHIGIESNAPPQGRSNLFSEQPQQRASNQFNNNLADNPEKSQLLSNPRQFPNQLLSTNDNRTASISETNAHPAAHPKAPTNEMRNPFSPGRNSVRENTTGLSVQMLNWQEASARLTELGIKKFHLERGGQEGMFMFVCLYHPSETPEVTHRFEAEGNDPLVAVNQVLSQVDGWLQQQYQESHKYSGVSFTR